MTFGNYNTYGETALTQLLGMANELADEIGEIKWLSLVSATDRGKTHLAIAICRRWLERGKSAKFAVVPEMLKDLRDGFNLEGEESHSRRLDFLCKVGLLVLDDIGWEHVTTWSQEQVGTIINYRANHQLPLVVTTNKEIDNLPIDPLGRIASRLQRERWCRLVVLDCEEHRLRGKKGRNSSAR